MILSYEYIIIRKFISSKIYSVYLIWYFLIITKVPFNICECTNTTSNQPQKIFFFWKLLLDYYVLNKHLMMNGFQLPFWAVFTLLAQCINHCMCAKEIILLSVQKFVLESIFDSLALLPAFMVDWASPTQGFH